MQIFTKNSAPPKWLFSLTFLAVTFFLALPSTLMAQTTGCGASAACFDFNYKGYVVNSNNTVTLSFGIRTNCGHDLSHCAFELPAGAKATNPTNANAAFRYSLENTTNNPFYSLKFNATNVSGYKNGVEDVFSYTLTTTQFNKLNNFRVEAKAGTTVGTVTFNAKGCCDNPVALTGPAAVCPNSLQTFSVTPVAGVQNYTWTLPPGWSVRSGAGTHSITVKTNGNAGSLNAKAGFNSCGSRTITMLSPQAPATPAAIAGPDVVCKNSAYSFEVPAVPGTDYYTWTVPAGWQIVSAPVLNGYGNRIDVVTGNTSGSVTVKAVCNVCSVLSSAAVAKQVTQAAPVAIQNITGDLTPCLGSIQTYTVNATNAVAYTWTVPTGDSIIAGQGTNTISVKINVPVVAHQLSVTATGQNNCTTDTENLTIQLKGCCTYTVAMNGPESICAGSTQTYSVTPLAGNQTYAWTFPAGWVVLSGAGTPEVTVKTNATAGTVKVQAGFSTCATKTVTLLAPVVPGIPASLAGPAVVCKNGTYDFEVPAITGADYYNWTVPAGWQIVSDPVLNGYGTKISVTAGNTNGQISVSAVANTCILQASLPVVLPVTVAPEVSMQNITGDSSPCLGSIQTYSVNATNATGYTWTVPAGDSILTGQGTNSITVKVADPATVHQLSVTATGPNNCSTVTRDLTFRVKAPQAINAHPVPSAIFSGRKASFSVNATGADLSYQWQVNTGAGWQNIVDNASYQNANTATLQVVNAPAAMNGYQYRCLVTGCSAVISTKAASLSVTQAIAVNLKVLLEGPYNPATGLMNTGQNAAGFVPLSQPYNNTYWNYYGTESVAAGFFAANPNLVDWVLLEVRSGLDKSLTLATAPAFLRNDGQVVGLDGQSLPQFINIPDGNYFVVVHHRNHLSIVTRTRIALNSDPQEYDFTTDYEKSYGVNPLKRTPDNRWALYAGDANASGSVSTSDWNTFWKREVGQSGYMKSDWNLDGIVNQGDYTLWYGNGGATTQVFR